MTRPHRAVTDPGPLLGHGRSADVYDLGDGTVLRRYRPAAVRAGLVEREAMVMRHLADHGFPVPVVHDASGADLVMQRLDGHTMLTDLERRPWRLGRHAERWAELHRRLATVPVGDLVDRGVPARFGSPESILPLDFHPDNIMLTPDGPVVFDWTNATIGPAAADVAQSWIVGATSTVDGGFVIAAITRLVRGRLMDRFVDACGRADAIAMVPTMAEYRLQDRNVRPEEAARIHALVASLRGPEAQSAQPAV
jgi:aminoglycoside phosphotransferase (APT) family kinase protein